MYSTVRTLHLCAALFSLAFLMMYTLSAIQMGHTRWFNLRPTVTTERHKIAPGLTDARAATRELVGKGVRGELRAIQSVTPERMSFRIVRPGTVYDVDYTAATGEAPIKVSTAGFMGYLNRIHHIEGLYHEWPLLNVWAVCVGLISIALFTLGVSGLYLWLQNHRERIAGGILLGAAVLFTGSLIVWMR